MSSYVFVGYIRQAADDLDSQTKCFRGLMAAVAAVP